VSSIRKTYFVFFSDERPLAKEPTIRIMARRIQEWAFSEHARPAQDEVHMGQGGCEDLLL